MVGHVRMNVLSGEGVWPWCPQPSEMPSLGLLPHVNWDIRFCHNPSIGVGRSKGSSRLHKHHNKIHWYKGRNSIGLIVAPGVYTVRSPLHVN